ncbi:hypothetical protein A3J78_01215 [Candidatus Beckwithbacteria bacterium RBG_13_35_6]|uniref:Uncharacterized protein n=1 Tax=Candidatus Beckwithbacteria bacterium RBG_13_35_6 TaxID=1797456 RepID=A0A1F5DBM0_9BACT|nr:MAG: hypothetical protein A3J78_01215 [Candidatus Beckwithbacteria bacterium RBG_13_35_6]
MFKKPNKKLLRKRAQKKRSTVFLLITLAAIIFILLILKINITKRLSVDLKNPNSSQLNDLDQQIKNERIDDPLAGLEIVDYKNQNPWLYQLPITTDSYVIVYNWEKKAIRARLIIKPDTGMSYDDQVESLKKEVKEKLTTIGVDLNKTPVYFTFIP